MVGQRREQGLVNIYKQWHLITSTKLLVGGRETRENAVINAACIYLNGYLMAFSNVYFSVTKSNFRGLERCVSG